MSEPPASVIVGVQRFPQSVVVEIIERFDSAGIMFWVDGGWGVDALLRKQAREHWDLDLVVRQADLPAAVRELRALGYSHEPDVVRGFRRGWWSAMRRGSRSTFIPSCWTSVGMGGSR